jgi:hypothetical protein
MHPGTKDDSYDLELLKGCEGVYRGDIVIGWRIFIT